MIFGLVIDENRGFTVLILLLGLSVAVFLVFSRNVNTGPGDLGMWMIVNLNSCYARQRKLQGNHTHCRFSSSQNSHLWLVMSRDAHTNTHIYLSLNNIPWKGFKPVPVRDTYDVFHDCHTAYSCWMNTTLMQSSVVPWSAGEPNRCSSLRKITFGSLDVKLLPLTGSASPFRGSASPGHVTFCFPQEVLIVLHRWLAPLLEVLYAKYPSSWVLCMVSRYKGSWR